MRAHAPNVPTSSTRHVQVTRYDVGLSAAELHAIAQSASRPATGGLEIDFISGVDISTDADANSPFPSAVRIVSFVSGASLGTVTVTGAMRSDLDTIDLTAILRAAVRNSVAIF